MQIEFTNAVNGGFGVLGKGIYKALSDYDKDIILAYGTPEVLHTAREKYGDKPLVYYTVWESSIYPTGWVDGMKKFNTRLVLTASEFTKQSIIKAGWDGDIAVWHHGIDERWQYREPLNDDVFTFLHYNAFEWRKGWDLVLEAYLNEFAIEIGEGKVNMLFKCRSLDGGEWIKDNTGSINIPGLEIKEGHISDQEMVDLFKRADCGVFPVRGEGWFLPATECVAMGIPVIMPNKMAMSEQWGLGYYDVELAGYFNSYPRYSGYMIEPSIESLGKQMRHIYENYSEISGIMKQASDDIHRKFNWKKIAEDFKNYINYYKL